MALLDYEWRGPWQREMAESICEHPETINQGPRQATGKTFVNAIYGAARIVHGDAVIIGMPTMRQAKSILFREIANKVKAFQKVVGGKAFKPGDIDTAVEKVYNNGGQLLALSLDKMAEKEGFTGDVLFIEESHRTDRGVLGVFRPFIAVAEKEGRSKIILTGIGGHPMSLIEEMKGEEYHLTKTTAEEIVAHDEQWQNVFDSFKKDMNEPDFRQHILCEPISPGQHHIFEHLPVAVPFPPEISSKWPGAVYYFGMDVGRTSDQTCVAVLRKQCGYYDLVDVHYDIGPFTAIEAGAEAGQDVRVFAFIDRYPWRPRNIACEVNGIGEGLADVLQREMLTEMIRVHLDYKFKKAAIDWLWKSAREGTFRVQEPEWIAELERLQYEIKMTDKGSKYEWDHSDLLSGIIQAALLIMGEAFSR